MVVVVAVLLVAGVVVAATAALRSPCTVTPVRCTMAPRLSFGMLLWPAGVLISLLPFAHSFIVRSFAQRSLGSSVHLLGAIFQPLVCTLGHEPLLDYSLAHASLLCS